MRFPTECPKTDLTDDAFGYSSLAERLFDELLLKMESPNCFGIYGNWGSGKSTLLHFIKQHAAKTRSSVLPVLFEPWKYEYSDRSDLMFALLRAIKKESGMDNGVWKKILTDVAVVGLGVARGLGVNPDDTVSDFSKVEQSLYKEHELWVDKVEEFNDEFQKVVNAVLTKNNASTLMLLIDDLDRCLPENVIKLLEGVKNFLSVKGVIVVVAIDRRIVAEMIDKKYGLRCGYGDEYLTKIIHYYFELPTVNIEIIVEEVLRSYGIRPSQRQVSYMTRFLSHEAKEPRLIKHLLHQMGLSISLSLDIRLRIEGLQTNQDEEYLLHVFVASYLLTRFPRIFSSGDHKRLLRSMRGAAFRIGQDNRNDELEKARKSYQHINPTDCAKIENIILSYPINSGNESSPDTIITDTDTIGTLMLQLRQSYTTSG